MRPTKLSSKVFLELPPVLAHYIESERNIWIEADPSRGHMSLLERLGSFIDLEAEAVDRRQRWQILGEERAKMLAFRTGFEQGRRDAARHFEAFGHNSRLALQAGLVFAQMQGRFRAEMIKFEFDLDARTLYREIALTGSMEAMAHRMALGGSGERACWATAGYLSGHVSEIIGRRVITIEQACCLEGHETCRLVSRLEAEWGAEADWARAALQMEPLDKELTKRGQQLEEAQNEARRAQRMLSDLSKRLRSEMRIEELIAESAPMEMAVKRARQLSGSSVPVLILGEPGTGREALARAIHAGGVRKNGPFILVDCQGMSGKLLAQEIVGFMPGAFPGAALEHKGAFVRANRGTLFLDDIASLDHGTQGILLHALSEGRITPLGASEPLRSDVRLIAASARDPNELLKKNVLREDFYYALAVAPIHLPPLRERGADVLLLAEMFLQQFAVRYDRPGLTFSEEVKEALMDCAWPGNVRQLRNVIEHAVVMSHEHKLTLANLPEDILATRSKPGGAELRPEVLQAALRRAKGNRSEAARLLGIGRTTLWRAMKRSGIE